MIRAVWTTAATEDLRLLALHIGEANQRILMARKVWAEIREKCNRYETVFSRGDQIGTDASNLGEGLRLFRYKR